MQSNLLLTHLQAAQRTESTAAEEDALIGEQKEGGRAVVCKEEKERGGLPGIECSVCLNRPVQVRIATPIRSSCSTDTC